MVPDLKAGEAASFAALEQTLAEGARWDELLLLYEGRLGRGENSVDTPALMARAAQLLLEKLEDPGRAEIWLKRLLEQEPNSVVGREGLQQIYEERGDHEALCELLERDALRASTPEQAAAAYVELGKLLDERLGRKARALLMWQRALRLVEDHPEALERSRICSIELGRLDAAKELIDRALASQPARSSVHVEHYVELSRLALEQPSHHELAAAAAQAALQADPDNVHAKARLEAIARLRAEWKSEVIALRTRAVEARDRKEASRLYLQAAALHGIFDSSDEAEEKSRENLERAFLLWPGNPEALAFLERRHTASGDFAGLIKAYEALIHVTPERSGKAELHQRMAMVYSVRFDDKERSVAALEQAVANDPARADAVVPLLEHLEDEGKRQEATELIERYLASAAGAGRAEGGGAAAAGVSVPRASALRLRLAELYLGLGKVDQGRAHLEIVLEQDPNLERVEELLEPLLDPQSHGGSLQRLLERKSDRSRDPQEKLTLLLRAARIPGAAPKERLKLLGHALLLAPSRADLHEELESLGRELGAAESVVRIYRAALASVDDPKIRLLLLSRMARVLDEELERPGEAAACIRQALELAPDDPDLLASLERLMELAGEHTALAEGYRKKLDRTEDPGERRVLLGKLAAHYEHGASDPAALVEVYRDLLALGPDRKVQRRLASTLGALSRWNEQRAILSTLAKDAGAKDAGAKDAGAKDAGAKEPGEDGRAAKMELAELLATKLEEPEQAAGLYLEILAEDPSSEAAIAALEELVQVGAATEEICAALEPIFQERGEWNRYALLLGVRVAAARDPGRKQQILGEIARVHAEKLQDPRGAFVSLTRAFLEKPTAGALLEQLVELAQELGAQAELGKLLQGAWRGADAAVDRALAERVATLSAGEGGDPELHAAALHRVLELSPDHVGALAALEKQAATAGRWAEATALVERLLAVDDTEHAAARGLRLAGYLRQQGLHADAARAMQTALAAGADADSTLPLLADALEKAGLHVERADVITLQIERATEADDGALAAQLVLQRARILEGLGSKVAAVADYAAILKERPFDPDATLGLEALLSDPEARVDAARALEKSYVTAGDWRKLHGVLEIQIAGSDDPVYRARELRRLSQLAARELKSPPLAFGALARAFEEAPQDALLRSELRVAAAEADCLEELAELMGEVMEQRSGDLPLPQLLAIEREIAELYEKKLDDRPGAIARFLRMRALEPTNLDALRGLHRLHREEGKWEELHEICLELAAAVYDLRERVSLWREAARIGQEQLEDPAKAAGCWRLIAEAEPSDGEALVQLDGLYVRLERWRDLAWVVERRRSLAIHAGALPAATELAFRLAELRRSACEDPKGALELFREVLIAEPDHAEARAALDAWSRRSEEGAAQALDLLDRVLRHTGQHERRLELREARLSVAIGAEERLRRFEELRTIAETDLQRPDMAFAVCARAFTEGVETETAHLERLARKSGRFQALAELYEAKLLHDPATSQELSRRAAELREFELKDREGAIAHWRTIASRTPDDPAAVEALERLYRAEGQARELVVTLERKAELEIDPAGRCGIFLEIARLLREPLGDPDRAIEMAQRALVLSPADEGGAELLTTLFTETHRWEELAALLEERIARGQQGSAGQMEAGAQATASGAQGTASGAQAMASGAQTTASGAQAMASDAQATASDAQTTASGTQATASGAQASASALHALRFELAQLRQRRLGDPRGAFALYEAILQEDPGYLAAREALEELTRDPDPLQAATAAQILAPVYEASQDHRRLVDMLETLAGAIEEPAQRATLYARVARIYAGPLDAPELAFFAAGRALRADPDSEGHLELVRESAEAAELMDELAGLLGDCADGARTLPGRIALCRSRALLLDQAGDRQAARDAWSKVSALVPNDREALLALARLEGEVGDPEVRLEVLRALLAQEEEPEGCASLLREIADIQETHLDQPEEALNSLRRVSELVGHDASILDAMDRLCVRTESWPGLEEVLLRKAELPMEEAPRRQLLVRLADLRESRLHDRSGALDLLAQVLRADPNHLAAKETLEGLYESDPSGAEIGALLEEISSAGGDWQRYAELLEERVGRIPDPEARKLTLVELAKVRRDRQGRPDLAFLALGRAYAEEPSDPAIWPLAASAAEAAEVIEEWVEIARREFARVKDRGLSAELALHLAHICETLIHDDEAAIDWLEVADRSRGVKDEQVLPGLERLYLRRERWADLARILERVADLTQEPATRTQVLARLGKLREERLRDPAGAAQIYERLLEGGPGHLATLRALESIYEAAGASEELLRNLQTQRDLHADGAVVERLLLRIGELAVSSGRKDLAIEQFRDLLSLDPGSELAAHRLEALYGEEGRHAELAVLLRERIGITRDPRELARLEERLGGILQGELSDPEGAVAAFHAVLDHDPRNRRALEALRELHGVRGEVQELAGILRRLIPLQDGTQGVKAIRLELAAALVELGKGDEALDSLKRILDLEPHESGELQRVEEHLRGLGAWSDVIRTLELQASLEGDGGKERSFERWSEIARIYDEELGRSEAGIPALEKILEARPTDRDAFDRLRAISSKAADWRRYAVATERFAVHCDEAEQLVFLREIAAVHERRLGQKELAFAKLSAAFELAPLDLELRADLERLAADCGMQEELAMIYESVAESRSGKPGTADLWIARGEILAGDLGDPDEAKASFHRALELDPRHVGALDALIALSKRVGDPGGLVAALNRKLEGCAPEERRLLLIELARTYDEELDDAGEAIYALRRAFELDPGDPEILESLSRLCRREGRFNDLITLLARTRDLAVDPAAKVALQLRIASVHETDLVDSEAAITAYEAALELAPASYEAMEALERLFTKDDRYAELLRIYDRKLQLSQDPKERSRLFVKAARIWEEKLQNPTNAIACLDGVLSIDPANQAALRDLARLLREQGSWERLAVVLRHHEALLEGDLSQAEERLDLRVRLGEVLYRELKQAPEAERLFLSVLEQDPQRRSAVGALAQMYERSGNWPQALAMLEREARLVDDVSDAVELHARIAKIHADMLGDVEQARSSYERVLELDPSHLGAIRGLRAIFQGRKDGPGYVRALEQEAAYTEDPAEKTRIFDELGRYHLEVAEDKDEAIRAFESARKYTPEDRQSNLTLSDLYVEREQWAQAEEVLDVVCSKLAVKGGEPGLLLHKVYRLGVVATKLEKRDKALRSFARAYELDPTFLPAAEGLGNMLAATGDHAQALKVFQAILIHHRDDLTDPEVVEVYFTIGELRRKLGDPQAAIKSLRSAVELDPWHADSHRAMVALADELKDAELAIQHRQELVELVEDDEKVGLLRKIAALASTELGDHYLAIDSVAAALRLRPNHLPSMDALLELYRETRQGAKEVELLEEMVAMPEVAQQPEAAIRYHLRLGQRYAEDAAKDPEALAKAVSEYNAVLNLDWRQTTAFQALEALLVQAKDWRELEVNYVRMLERLGRVEGTTKARAVLFRTLGDLHLEALSDKSAAIEAYKAVTVLAPDDASAAEKYARLLSEVRGLEADAIAAWRKAIPLQPSQVEGARMSMRLHARRKDYDAAFSAAQVITWLLEAGGSDEEELLARLKPFGKDSATGVLTDRHWHEQLYRPEQRGPIGGILAIVQTQAGAIFARDHSALHIQGRDIRLDRKRDRVDVATSMLFFANAYRYVAHTCGMEAMELYKVQGVVGLTLADTWPHCLVAGEELFTDQRPKQELYFHIGRVLAWSRPELSMALLRPREQVELVIESAASLGDPSLKTRFNAKTVEKVRRQLARSISPASQQTLKKLAAAYQEQRPDVGAYLEAAEMTATRAGALLAGDLRVAARCIAEAASADRSQEERRQRDLVSFCLSDHWASLRKELGLQVVVPG